MLITDLPNDCLLLIFNTIYDLQDLLRCFKVNNQWRKLITYRLRRVRYLHFAETFSRSIDDETINYNNQLDSYQIDEFNFAQLLPHLKIIDLSNSMSGSVLDTFKYKKLLEMVKRNLKGLIIPMQFDNTIDNMIEECDNIEMIASHCLGWRSKKLMVGWRIKQLSFNYESLSYIADRIRYFPNLTRLHLYYHFDRLRLRPNNPILAKLEIIELSSIKVLTDTSPYHGFRFMDLCPLLKSAYHSFDCKRGIVEVTSTNGNLQDLVINYKFNSGHSWTSLEKLLSNYQNLQHLAIRRNTELRDEHIVKIVQLLPRLTLIDVRGSRGITSNSRDSLECYCKSNNRSVYFYHEPGNQQILNDWPHLSRTHRNICKGYDFMRNCFLKTFEQLPLLMDDL